MPDQNPFPPAKQPSGKPPRYVFQTEPNPGGEPGGALDRFDAQLEGSVKRGAKFIDDQFFDDKVIEPLAEVAEDFIEAKIGKAPLKKFVGGPGLFLIEHTIISHSGRGADPGFVTVRRRDGTTFRYADTSFQPRQLARGEKLVDAPTGTVLYVSPLDGSVIVLPADSPLAQEALRGSLQPEKIRPVNAKAIANQEAAEGINRELVTERADP